MLLANKTYIKKCFWLGNLHQRELEKRKPIIYAIHISYHLLNLVITANISVNNMTMQLEGNRETHYGEGAEWRVFNHAFYFHDLCTVFILLF